MNHVSIDTAAGTLVVVPQGLSKVWGFRRRIEVPLAHVRGATVDPGAVNGFKGVRGPGLGLPHMMVGTWRKDGRRFYWNARKGSDVVVVSLTDEHFEHLYLTVDAPEALVDEINQAARV